MDQMYGFPVVDSVNIFEVLADLGVHPWDRTMDPMLLTDYANSGLTEAQQSELRFAPRVEAVKFEKPNGGEYTAFRATLKPWATTIALLPPDGSLDIETAGLVPIVGEWKHGEETVSLAPPSGVMGKADVDIQAAGEREFEEETGMKLASITLLASDGIPINCRHLSQRFYPFLGTVSEPIVKGPSTLDDTEFLEIVLVPVEELAKLFFAGKITEACTYITMSLALPRLGLGHLLAVA